MYHFCFVVLCICGQFSKYKPLGGLYLEGRFNGGFFALPDWRGLYLEGIIHGGAYFRNFTVFYFRLFYFILFFQIYFYLYTSTIYIVTTTLHECLQMTRLWLGSYKKLKPFLRTFQGPPTRNVMLLTEQKCTFPVDSDRTLSLELFAPTNFSTSSVHLS